MSDKKKKFRVVAFVPMKHKSERVPGKNYRSFAGKPLYHRIIGSLLDCKLIDEVVIDTDSLLIEKDCQKHFPSVRLLKRPKHLRSGETPMNDVLLNTVKQIEADFYLQTHSTNPLLKTKTITKALKKFLRSYPRYDSLFSVTRLQTRLWDQVAKAINHNPSILLRTQDLPPVYEENSNIYIFTRDILEKRHNRIGRRPLMFEVDAEEVCDIDEEIDFKMAEFLFKERKKSKKR
jgi:CMP-N-acetylneuraminic acid synthetase